MTTLRTAGGFLALCVGSCMLIASANSLERGAGVRTTCSQSKQGLLLFSECSSTIAYLDSQTSEVYYCNGTHRVVTKGRSVHERLLTAECTLTFRPFQAQGDYVLLDVTKNQLTPFAGSNANLYPDGITWVVGRGPRDLQYCSRFLAGFAGTQSKCVAATFK